MTFLAPAWLLLLIPAAFLAWQWRPVSRAGQTLRYALYGLMVLAMAQPAWQWSQRAGTVVVVVDRSASMPTDAQARQLEAIKLLHTALDPTRHRLAVVAFGQRTAVELPPGIETLSRFTQDVGTGGSDLAAALRRSQALIPTGAPGRVLLLSDGRSTGAAPWPEAAALAARSVAVDVRALSRPRAGDAAVREVQAPSSVGPGEAFMMTAWVSTPTAGPRRYVLSRGATVVASGTRDFEPGTHRLRFRDRVSTSGSAGYTLDFESVDPNDTSDPVPENNHAQFVVGVRGPRPLLHITQTPGGGLAQLLSRAGLTVQSIQPRDLDGSVDQLANHAAVLLENVAAADLPSGTLDTLAGLVEETGTGLLMTGGQRSFGPGGYFQSAIDPLLPVSMELRQEHRKLSLAIVVALDRSGSMAMTVPGGRQKMDLANLGTAQVVDLLSPMDEMGIIAVDSAAHTIADLAPVTHKAALRAKALSVDSMGGGIYVYEALEAAARMLEKATAGTKHIILFSDAQDSEHPADYRTLLDVCRKSNITVSVIGLGTDHDVDAGLLKDVAARGGGRIFFTQDAAKLPALFAQDTFAVARSAFINEATAISTTAGYTALTGASAASDSSKGGPVAGGYNLTYLRPQASPALITQDEYKAPFVATWSAGLGRAATFAGEADGKFTTPLDQWAGYGDLLASLGRYVVGRTSQNQNAAPLPPTLLARRRVNDGQLVVELLLDPDRPTLDLPAEPIARVLIVTPGLPPRRVTLPLRYEAPDILSARLPLTSADTAVAALDLGVMGHVALPPARLLYDPEYRPAPQGKSGSGAATLQRLVDLTHGTQRADLPAVWNALPELTTAKPIAWVFWLLAVLALLFDVLERRTHWISGLFSGLFATKGLPKKPSAIRSTSTRATATPRQTKQKTRQATPPASSTRESPSPSESTPIDHASQPPSDLSSALDAATKRSQRRNKSS
ncbi:MAG: VWA domain-containing protein [Algisphaera sp.]